MPHPSRELREELARRGIHGCLWNASTLETNIVTWLKEYATNPDDHGLRLQVAEIELPDGANRTIVRLLGRDNHVGGFLCAGADPSSPGWNFAIYVRPYYRLGTEEIEIPTAGELSVAFDIAVRTRDEEYWRSKRLVDSRNFLMAVLLALALFLLMYLLR
jgi:hypothetical protein